MEGEKSRLLPALGAFLLIILMGVAGYYLGRYLDMKDLKTNTKAPVATKYQYSNLGVDFTYPKTWNLKESTEKSDVEGVTDVKVVTVTSPNGSILEYRKITTSNDPVELTCNETDPKGEEDGNETCIFFGDTDLRFARVAVPVDADSDPIWRIAERTSVGSKKYKYNSTDGFSYLIKNENDVNLLDSIIESLERTN